MMCDPSRKSTVAIGTDRPVDHVPQLSRCLGVFHLGHISGCKSKPGEKAYCVHELAEHFQLFGIAHNFCPFALVGSSKSPQIPNSSSMRIFFSLCKQWLAQALVTTWRPFSPQYHLRSSRPIALYRAVRCNLSAVWM